MNNFIGVLEIIILLDCLYKLYTNLCSDLVYYRISILLSNIFIVYFYKIIFEIDSTLSKSKKLKMLLF